MKRVAVLLLLIALVTTAGFSEGRWETPIPLNYPVRMLPADTGYIDYSTDRTTIFFNKSGKYPTSVFLDFFAPFDPSDVYPNYAELSKYEMTDPSFRNNNGDLMISLDELSRLYAPYFTVGISAASEVTIRHLTYIKDVVAGHATRTPTLVYHKTLWEASIKGSTVSVKKTTYKPLKTNSTTNIATRLAELGVAAVEPPVTGTLSSSPVLRNGKVYVPVASLMSYLGKSITDGYGYLAVRTDFSIVGGYDFPFNTAATTWTGWEKISDRKLTWADYMNGVLDGTITKGVFWRSYYVGTVDLHAASDYGLAVPSNPGVVVDRILGYKLYIPKDYDPAVPSKMTFMLHGATGNQNAPFDRILRHDISIEDLSDEFNYIVLLPNGWTRGPAWLEGPARYNFFKAYEDLKSAYNIDEGKVFIKGNSAGGKGAFDLAVRYPHLFKAFAATNPVYWLGSRSTPISLEYVAPIANMPGFVSVSTDDVTIRFKELSPWAEALKSSGVLKNTRFNAVEAGHHSFGWGSVMRQVYTVFDKALEANRVPTPASIEISLNQGDYVVKNGTVMVGLPVVQKMLGPAFSVFEVRAYNEDPTRMVSVQNLILGNNNINIHVEKTYYRINPRRYKEDAIQMKEDDINSLEPAPHFPVAPYMENGQIFIPALEVLQALGCKVQRVSPAGAATAVFRIETNQ